MSVETNKEKIEQLIAIFSDPTGYDQTQKMVWAAAHEVAKFKEEAVVPLLAALRHEDSTVRAQAAFALGIIGDVRATLPLIPMLLDEDMGVKQQAAWALGDINDKRAIPYLLKLLDFNDPEVQGSVITALGWFKTSEVVEALLALLEKTTSPLVINDTVFALGMIGDVRALDKLKLLRQTLGAMAVGGKLQDVMEEAIAIIEVSI